MQSVDWKADLGSLFLRVSLAACFLSAVADRFGLWGEFGQPQVAWGNFSRFVQYTHTLTSAFPMAISVLFAWVATAAEVAFAILLLVGWRVRNASLLSGCLLLTFALAMTITLGVKGAFDYSVPSAAAAAILLSQLQPDRFTFDWWLRKRRREV